MSITRILLAATCLICLFSACKKDTLTDNTTGKRLQRTVSRWQDSLFYVAFSYDSANRLITVTDSNNTNKGDRLIRSIQYDNLDNPVKSVLVYHFKAGDTRWLETDSLVYQNNRVVKRIIMSNSYTLNANLTVHKYTYDSKGHLVADSVSGSNNQTYFVKHFTFDENDNLVQWQTLPTGNNYNDEMTALYSAEKSVYNSLGGMLYFWIWNDAMMSPLMMSEHAVRQVKYTTSGTNYFYSYEHDPRGLITKVGIGADDNSSYFTTEFFYE
jgi:YD repeat-containing protein